MAISLESTPPTKATSLPEPVTLKSLGVETILLAGESMPVEKKTGDVVFAGTINGEGSLEVKVAKAFTDTKLAKIIKLVGEARGQKAPS